MARRTRKHAAVCRIGNAGANTAQDDKEKGAAPQSSSDAPQAIGSASGPQNNEIPSAVHLQSDTEPPSPLPTDPSSDQSAHHPIYSRATALRFVRLNHSVVFFLFAAVGVAALLCVKWLSAQFDILFYFLAVALIMGFYFVINMIDFAGLRLRYDQLGDNLYYLGFIYTLGALTHTLYIFDGKVANISEVISSFGIALSSTVLGVLLRIVAHLMSIDPNEVDDVVRTELADVTSRLRASLDNVVRDMTIFGDQTRQVIQELRDDTSQSINTSVHKLVSSSDRVLESVDRSFQVFTENTTRINKLADRTVEVLAALVARIQSVEAPADLIERKLIPATDQIERIVSIMSEGAKKETERSERLRQVTESMTAAVSAITEHVDLISGAVSQKEIAERVSIAASALKDMSGLVSSMRSEMKSAMDAEVRSLADLRQQIEGTVQEIRAQSAAARQELGKYRSVTAETQDSLVELARALRRAI